MFNTSLADHEAQLASLTSDGAMHMHACHNSHNLKGNLPNEGVVCKQASSHASYEIGSAAFRHHQKTVWWRAMMLEREQGLHPCTSFQLMTGPPAHSPSAQLSQASWPLLPLTSRCISFPSLSFLSFLFFSFHLISSHLISFHFTPYGLGCGANGDRSDILASKHKCFSIVAQCCE